MNSKKTVVTTAVSTLAVAALTGIFSGTVAAESQSFGGSGIRTTSSASGYLAIAGQAAGDFNEAGKHDCKGKNACKGQGGCKTGDNGCKGKNTCKGKGGCGSKE